MHCITIVKIVCIFVIVPGEHRNKHSVYPEENYVWQAKQHVADFFLKLCLSKGYVWSVWHSGEI